MIKQIKKFQIKLTPFDAVKDWEMSSTNNQDLLLYEDTGSGAISDIPLALEFIDYGILNTSSFDNFECDIALEQQPDDLFNVRMGENIVGFFYPQLDPLNIDGTYQRAVFYQVRTMFYNQFHDPTKIWGLDNIDFALSKTKRKIADQFRLFDAPDRIYGDEIVPNSVTITDNSIDDTFSITDDGNGNLLAGNNLFTHRQEIGKYPNYFFVGHDVGCNFYFGILEAPHPPSLLLNAPTSTTNSLSWSLDAGSPLQSGFNLERSVNNSSSFTLLTTTTAFTYNDFPVSDTSTTYYYRVQAFNQIGNSAYSNIVFNANIVDSFNEYPLGATSGVGSSSFNFNSGSGWANPWFVDSINRLISSESWDEYTLGQTHVFAGGYGWSNIWHITASNYLLVASESFDEYSLGQDSNFTGGFGWSIPVTFVTTSVQTETFDEYSIGQTTAFTGGFAWVGPWSNSSGSI